MPVNGKMKAASGDETVATASVIHGVAPASAKKRKAPSEEPCHGVSNSRVVYSINLILKRKILRVALQQRNTKVLHRLGGTLSTHTWGTQPEGTHTWYPRAG